VATELGLDARRIGPYEPTVLAGLSAALRVAELDATAVQAYNDQLAIGIVKGLGRLRISVPEQVSVVGFDNIIFDELVEPQLTTIASPLYRMGFTGVRNCIAVAQGAQPSGDPLILPVRLVVRGSTGQRRRPPSLARAQSNDIRWDSRLDSTLGSSTSIMKSPS
jgi:LacI family transcriptional regulator